MVKKAVTAHLAGFCLEIPEQSSGQLPQYKDKVSEPRGHVCLSCAFEGTLVGVAGKGSLKDTNHFWGPL